MNNAIAMQRVNRVSDMLDRNRGTFMFVMTVVLAAAMLLVPDLAYAQSIIDEKADSALAWIRRAVYFILVVAVLGSGVLAAFGRMSWATVGQVLIGAIVAGVATEVVGALYGDG